MALSRIEWTESTWNPVTGCTKVSAGCKNCYAERMAYRLKAMGVDRYADGFEVRVHNDVLVHPLRWRKPRLIFVNSMSDLFHESVPDRFIQEVFSVMTTAWWHTFQVLTKRADRLQRLAPDLSWPENVWMGVSVESAENRDRIHALRRTPAHVKFLSIEPLIAPVGRIALKGVDWVIVGGESGPGARPMDPSWVRSVQRQCSALSVPFFFKQWGGANKKANGRILDGQTWDELPRVSMAS